MYSPIYVHVNANKKVIKHSQLASININFGQFYQDGFTLVVLEKKKSFSSFHIEIFSEAMLIKIDNL